MAVRSGRRTISRSVASVWRAPRVMAAPNDMATRVSRGMATKAGSDRRANWAAAVRKHAQMAPRAANG
jgi:hypothetical protein